MMVLWGHVVTLENAESVGPGSMMGKLGLYLRMLESDSFVQP